MLALKVAREDDPGALRDRLGPVHVAERPVALALRREPVDGRRRVRLVFLASRECRVGDANFQRAGDRDGIGRGEVVGSVPPRETLAVDREAEPGHLDRLGAAVREDVDVVGEPKRLRAPAPFLACLPSSRPPQPGAEARPERGPAARFCPSPPDRWCTNPPPPGPWRAAAAPSSSQGRRPPISPHLARQLVQENVERRVRIVPLSARDYGEKTYDVKVDEGK